MINVTLHPISHRFQVNADYWSNLHFRQGVPLFNVLVRGWIPELTTVNSETIETSPYRAVQNAFRYLEPFIRGSRVWRSDGQTDGQTGLPHCSLRPPDMFGCNYAAHNASPAYNFNNNSATFTVPWCSSVFHVIGQCIGELLTIQHIFPAHISGTFFRLQNPRREPKYTKFCEDIHSTQSSATGVWNWGQILHFLAPS